MPTRGRLIVVEGLDRAGKSTQVTRLLSNLHAHNHAATNLRFPDRTTPIGQSLNSYLSGQTQSNDHAIHLLFSANRWEAVSDIQAKLAAGTTLVVDRYSFSGAVYSAAKRVAGLDLEWAWSMEVGLPKPDLVIYLTVTPEVQGERGGFGKERYESEGMQMAVREAFEEVWKHWEGRVVRIEADGSLEEVEERVWKAVEEVMEGEVGSLETLTALKLV